MAAELVAAATNEKLKEMDWMKNIEICELVTRDPGQSKDVVKAIKKRIGSKNPNAQLWSINLLEMLMNNCGEHTHSQVIDSGLLPILVKIVKKKSDLPVREKIFLLLDATQTSLGGASGRFPQYYAAYYELVSAGVKFSQAPRVVPSEITNSKVHRSNSSGGNPVPPKPAQPAKPVEIPQQPKPQMFPESSIIEKAGAALEVLRDVLNAIDSQHPEGARDEFTLDLVEQCSFQKQRVMHLVLSSRDENIVSQAIKLNDQLETALVRHDALLSAKTTSTATHQEVEEEEEEDEMLFRRLRKGKACMRPEDEEPVQRPVIIPQGLHRPLIRSLSIEKKEPEIIATPAVIPPPPAKHVEREKFFQKRGDGSTIEGNMGGLTLHSRNVSSSASHSGSIDSSD
ncbi:hypothetical protein ACHQM5_022521 [Ranunculus cassubicifolius]